MADTCKCGGGCGCGGHHHGEHHHEHGEGGCGCGGHHHGEHHHEHGEGGCGCGCGGHHHEHEHDEADDFEDAKVIVSAPATAEQRAFLSAFERVAPLPVAKYVLKSSKEHSFESVALRDVCLREANDSIETIKETAAFLQGLEASNLVAIDYDVQLDDASYAHFYDSASFALFQETVAAGAENTDFLGDIAELEKGCLVLTAWAKEELAR